MPIVQTLIVALGVLVLLGGALWMARRAAGHDDTAELPLVPSSADLVPNDPHVRHQTRQVAQAKARSAQIHRDAARLVDELRAYEDWRRR